MATRVLTFTLLAMLGILAGCQGTAPSTPETAEAQSVAALPPIATGAHSELAAIGLSHLRLTPGVDGWSGELLPARMASVAGDAYEIDVTRFFTQSPCGDCAKVTGIGIEADGRLAVEITVRHPFRAPDALGAPRADLHVFDLMGFIIANGLPGQVGTFAPDNIAVRTVGTVLNADGFSALWDDSLENWILTPAVDAHPYKLFNVDGTQGNFSEGNPNGFGDITAPAGHNVFPMGATARTTYSLNVPANEESLWGFALVAAYGQSARKKGSAIGERQNPRYFLPEFNTKAPWRVTATLTNNGLTGGVTSSSADLQVAVRDWQSGADLATGWDFDATPLNQARASSEINEVSVAVPDLMGPTPLVQTGSSGTGTGLYEDRLFDFVLLNSEGATQGSYGGLVTVTDTLSGTTVGLDRDLIPFTLGAFTTYQYFEVAVIANPNVAPVLTCPLNVTPNPPTINVSAQFSAGVAIDPDNTPGSMSYEWDFDYTGAPTDFAPADSTTANPNTTHTFTSPVATTVGLRAVDALGAISNVCTVSFVPNAGLPCADVPQFAVQNQTNVVENYNQHFYSGGIGGYPSQGWNQSLAVSPVSSDVYLLLTARMNGQTDGGFYVQRSSDGGCTWGIPVLVANRNDPPPPPPHPATNWDQWNFLPYTATIGCTADGHPVVAFMEGIDYTRFVYGTNNGVTSTNWALPQSIFIYEWGSYYEWFHQVLPDPIDPSRITIAWRGARQPAETFPGGSLSGCIRMATTTNAGPAATWTTRVLVDGATGGAYDKRNVFSSLGSQANGNEKDVFVVWNSESLANLYLVKYEFSTDLASPVVQIENSGGIHRDPSVVVDSANNPIVIYDTAGSGKDIVARKGVDGFPPSFPNPAVTVNSAFTAGDQTVSRAVLDPATNRIFVLVQDEAAAMHQLQLVTLDSSMAVIATIGGDTNDPSGTLFGHRHPHIEWRAPHLFMMWQDAEYTLSSPTVDSQWRDAMRILTR